MVGLWNAMRGLLPLLLAFIVLAGCSDLGLPKEDMPAVDLAAYRVMIANSLKRGFKDYASYGAFEIADFRWVHSTKGWAWLACVRFQDRQHRRTYVWFIQDKTFVDWRYAVQTDACDVQTYSPFDPATGEIKPTAISGEQGPLY